MKRKIVSFGEIMLRLSPQHGGMISSSSCFDACYGGTESNVLICLSCLGDATSFLTALPDNDLGEAVLRHLNRYHIETSKVLQQGDILGTYFLEDGFGTRSSKVIYHRKHSEVSKLDEDAFNYDDIFQDCSLFHISGISFALSDSSERLCLRLIKEAKARQIPVSFDFNYRSKLWSIEKASNIYKQVVNYVDLLFCSSLDLSVFLHTDISRFYEQYSCEYVFVREREVCSNSKHIAKACAYHKTDNGIASASTDKIEIDVLDRIGSGDAFTAGVLHSICNNKDDLKYALNFGMACFALKHTIKGDILTMSEQNVKSYLNNFSKDVIR